MIRKVSMLISLDIFDFNKYLDLCSKEIKFFKFLDGALDGWPEENISIKDGRISDHMELNDLQGNTLKDSNIFPQNELFSKNEANQKENEVFFK